MLARPSLASRVLQPARKGVSRVRRHARSRSAILEQYVDSSWLRRAVAAQLLRHATVASAPDALLMEYLEFLLQSEVIILMIDFPLDLIAI